mmetsp:Transcript_16399/g.48866  ORF Transcript_16399/g.48866 Transcript_16399/m.48866 type:complete len:205 (-) Transcript_16399:991-1605(-)
MTAASATSGWPIARFSISMVLIHSPPDLTTSFDLSAMSMCPSASMLATSPVANQPSPSVAGVPFRKYSATTIGPRTCRCPMAFPSCGSSTPLSSTTRMSHKMCGRPCLTLFARTSSVRSRSTGAFGAPTVPSGDSSVMPHRWLTVTPCVTSNASIIAALAAEPPMATIFSVLNDRRRCSMKASRLSHTVGTPAESVTRKSSISP